MFPTGRLLSRGWRVWVAVAVARTVTNVVAAGLQPGPLYGEYATYANPFGIPDTRSWMEAIEGVGFLLVLVVLVASIISVILRFRRSRGTEQQQLKWLLYDGVFVGLNALPFVIVEDSTIITALGVIAYASIPVATGIAILRYRLYDIDILINRTLVYASLTVMLTLVYFGGVTATQSIFQTLTGQKQLPQLAVVISTLVIAALFSPLRRSIQSFMDRRFYRHKYDARKSLEAFSARLRDETDLEALGEDLVVVVVRETMQPAHLSLWLRQDAATNSAEPRGSADPHRTIR